MGQLAGRSKREASAQEYEPAPDIPGVTCSLGRKKREAQSGERRYQIAYEPAPDIDLPPCSGGGGGRGGGGGSGNLPPCSGGGGGGGGGSGNCCTESGRRCIFPFSYKGRTYNQCTTDSSHNGKAWCAYGLKNRYSGDIEANTRELEDCQQSCRS